jgi:DNA invertase Pin-like site-specific DNA recombinase
MDNPPVPAARYLRMSTERQQYSLSNQAAAIDSYADNHGFAIVKSYSDEARTGVTFVNRNGLQTLIRDVIQRRADYKAVLVYDVSRWGRFQDTDEAAHYEILCKSAGIPIHNCAEPFSNDCGLPSLIMKSLKRVMAGEYSRELGVKVYTAQKRLAALGFRQGAQPGYGLRRLLVSADRIPKQLLLHGERKGLASDRVVQVPGPPEEVHCIQKIYRLFLKEGMTFIGIAKELNREGFKYIKGSDWNMRAVKEVLTNPKYAGFNVYGRFSTKLYTPRLEVPRSEWAVAPGAFEPVISPTTFAEVQRRLASFTRNQTDDQLLQALRATLAREGKLSMTILENTPGLPSPSAYRDRFGSVSRAFQLAGFAAYNGYTRLGRLEELRKLRDMRTNLMKEIVALSNGRVSMEDRGLRFRSRLRLGRRRVSVMFARYFRGYKGADRWQIKLLPGDTRMITLVVLLNKTNDGFSDLFVTQPIRGARTFRLLKDDPRLSHAGRLHDLRDFVGTIEAVSCAKPHCISWALTEPSDTVATKSQLKQISQLSVCEFIRRGMNQKTLERIRKRRPVRASKLQKCLRVVYQCEPESRRKYQC